LKPPEPIQAADKYVKKLSVRLRVHQPLVDPSRHVEIFVNSATPELDFEPTAERVVPDTVQV